MLVHFALQMSQFQLSPDACIAVADVSAAAQAKGAMSAGDVRTPDAASQANGSKGGGLGAAAEHVNAAGSAVC